MSRAPKGSHPTLTSELIQQLAFVIRRGVYVETACALCGISKDSFYRWLKQAHGSEPTDLTRELSDAVVRSLAEAEARLLSVIDAAAESGKWQAAAWRLERMFPKKWGSQIHERKDPMESERSEIPKMWRELSVEDLEARAEELRKKIEA